MISKRAERGEQGRFKDLAEYIKAAKEEGEKLDDLWIVNSEAGEGIEDLDMAISDVEAQQALNTRVKTDKQYHLVVSFRDEKPSAEALRDIERSFAEALGYADRPRVVATHTNTENFHMHVAYSRIHPETLKAHFPQKDFFSMEKVCRAMEKKHGLKIDLGREDKLEPSPLPQPARDMEAHTWEQSFAGFVQEHKPQLMKALDRANGWQDLHKAFSKYDLVLNKRGNGLVIGNRPTNQHSKPQHVKASSLDRQFSKAALEKRFGPYVKAVRSKIQTKPLKRYDRRPVTRHPRQARLWRQYIGQRRHRTSITTKAFKTWRDFLVHGIDDPLAMAIVVFHRKLIDAALNVSPSGLKPPLLNIPTLPAHVPATSIDAGNVTTIREKGQAAPVRGDVDSGNSDNLGAFKEDALTPQEALDSSKGLDIDGRVSSTGNDETTKPGSRKGKSSDRDRGIE